MPHFVTTSLLTKQPRTHRVNGLLALLAVMTAAAWPEPAASKDWFAGPLPPGHPTCHARAFTAVELAAHPDRRVTAISLERMPPDLATERRWHALEQFDGTPVISATLRVHLRGDPVSHAIHLECAPDENNVLLCTNPNCAGGQIQITGDGQRALAVSVGGTLKGGQFIAHYIHLDESCEGRPGGPIVLESGSDDRLFSLTPSAKESCR